MTEQAAVTPAEEHRIKKIVVDIRRTQRSSMPYRDKNDAYIRVNGTCVAILTDTGIRASKAVTKIQILRMVMGLLTDLGYVPPLEYPDGPHPRSFSMAGREFGYIAKSTIKVDNSPRSTRANVALVDPENYIPASRLFPGRLAEW